METFLNSLIASAIIALFSFMGNLAVAIVVTLCITLYFSKKANDFQKNLSELIITEITNKNINVRIDKNGKPYKNFNMEVKVSGKPNITVTGVKKEKK